MRTHLLAGALLLAITGAGVAQERAEHEGRIRLFISPMGEPFRRPADGEDPQDAWFAGADSNHDGMLSRAEFSADAMRFFALLDRGHDGEIDPDDISVYETVLVPEGRVGGGGMAGGGRRMAGRGGGGRRGGHRGGGGGEASESGGAATDARQGAARFSYFDYPEPIIVADTNFNRGIDPAEFQHAAAERFAMLDRDHDGVVRKEELPRLSLPVLRGGWRGGGGRRFGGGARPPQP